MFAGKKKKAKKILVNAEDAGGDEIAPAEGADQATEDTTDLDFSSLKKKKKKRVIDDQVASLDAQLEKAGVLDDKDETEEIGENEVEEGITAEEGKEEEEAWLKSDRDYTYEEVHPQ